MCQLCIYQIFLSRRKLNPLMALELIPYPISIIFLVVLFFAWLVILWKMRRRAKIYSVLFYASLIIGILLLIVLLLSLWRSKQNLMANTQNMFIILAWGNLLGYSHQYWYNPRAKNRIIGKVPKLKDAPLRLFF